MAERSVGGDVIGGIALALLVVLLSGCIVPFQTSAPPLSRTVGKGSVGLTMNSELPTVDLLATQEEAGDEYTVSPVPISSFQAHYGLADNVDLEGGFEAVFFGFPLPIGVSAGARYQPLEGKLSLALAGRVGAIGGSSSSGEDTYSANAKFAQVQVATQYELMPWLRPGLVLTAAPSAVSIDDNGTKEDFTAYAFGASASLTFVFGYLEIGPALNLAHLETPNIAGDSVLVSLGFYIGIRPQKKQPLVLNTTPMDPPPTTMPPPMPN